MTTKTNKPANQAPTHIVWFAPERNAPWARIGALWPTKDGRGFRQVLDLMPMAAGNLVILPNEPGSAEVGQ